MAKKKVTVEEEEPQVVAPKKGNGSAKKETASTFEYVLAVVPVDKITPNPNQIREEFDPQEANELTESVKAMGILHPIYVQSPNKEGEYTLISGERRWRAAKDAGQATVPAHVCTERLTKQEVLRRSLIENINRSDLNPVEKANAVESLVKAEVKGGVSEKEAVKAVAKSLGRSTQRVEQLRIIHADEGPAKKAMEQDVIGERAYREIKDLPPERQEEAVKAITQKRAGKKAKAAGKASPTPAEEATSPTAFPFLPEELTRRSDSILVHLRKVHGNLAELTDTNAKKLAKYIGVERINTLSSFYDDAKSLLQSIKKLLLPLVEAVQPKKSTEE